MRTKYFLLLLFTGSDRMQKLPYRTISCFTERVKGNKVQRLKSCAFLGPRTFFPLPDKYGQSCFLTYRASQNLFCFAYWSRFLLQSSSLLYQFVNFFFFLAISHFYRFWPCFFPFNSFLSRPVNLSLSLLSFIISKLHKSLDFILHFLSSFFIRSITRLYPLLSPRAESLSSAISGQLTRALWNMGPTVW